MEFNFTFKTKSDLVEAELFDNDITFKIVRVVVQKFNKQIWDIPLKTEEEYINFSRNLKHCKDKIIKVYTALHWFEEFEQ